MATPADLDDFESSSTCGAGRSRARAPPRSGRPRLAQKPGDPHSDDVQLPGAIRSRRICHGADRSRCETQGRSFNSAVGAIDMPKRFLDPSYSLRRGLRKWQVEFNGSVVQTLALHALGRGRDWLQSWIVWPFASSVQAQCAGVRHRARRTGRHIYIGSRQQPMRAVGATAVK